MRRKLTAVAAIALAGALAVPAAAFAEGRVSALGKGGGSSKGSWKGGGGKGHHRGGHHGHGRGHWGRHGHGYRSPFFYGYYGYPFGYGGYYGGYDGRSVFGYPYPYGGVGCFLRSNLEMRNAHERRFRSKWPHLGSSAKPHLRSGGLQRL